MHPFLKFVKTTLIGGALFLLPVVLGAVILGQAISYADKLLRPLSDMVSVRSALGPAAGDLLAATALLLVAFAAGLVAQTRLGRRTGERVQQWSLNLIPGYKLLTGLTKSQRKGSLDQVDGPEVSVALARLDEAWMLAFIIEEHGSGLLTVFVPSSPTPAAGTVYYLTESQVLRLDVTPTSAVRCVMQFGMGSKKLLGAVPPETLLHPRGSTP